MGTLVVSHGLGTSPAALKASSLAEVGRQLGFKTIVPDYRSCEQIDDRVEMLLDRLATATRPLALAGSSLGGATSVLAAQRRPVDGLFLIAPALYMPGYEHLDHATPCGKITIWHGWRDKVVPAEGVIRYAREHRAAMHLVNGGHQMHRALPEMLIDFEYFLNSLSAADKR